MPDDFLTALNYAIKEEVVENYFQDRRVLELEKDEYRKEKIKLEKLRKKAGSSAALLNVLLGETAEKFWSGLGLDTYKLYDNEHQGGAYFEKKKTFWQRTYRHYVEAAAKRFADRMKKLEEAFIKLSELADEINRDVQKFHLNHDFLALRAVLGNMDFDLLEKKQFLGCSLSGKDYLDMEKSLQVQEIEKEPDLFGKTADLPEEKYIVEQAARFADEMLRKNPEQIMRLVKK